MRAGRLALGGRCGLRGRLGLLRHHQRAQLGVGRQHTVKTYEVRPWPGHQCRKPLHEFQRRHDEVRRAVAPGCLEFEHHLPGSVGLNAFIGQRWARDVAARLLQRLAVVGAAAHGCVLR